MRELAGAQAFQTLMRRVATRFADPYRARVEGKPLAERIIATTEIIRERGSEVDCSQDGDGWLIRQFTCPFPKVAGENSCVCALDVEFVRQLAGSDARLTTSLLRGDRCCTFRVRPAVRAV